MINFITELISSNPLFYIMLGLFLAGIITFSIILHIGFKKIDDDNKNNPNY